jgi:hypothetical protein
MRMLIPWPPVRCDPEVRRPIVSGRSGNRAVWRELGRERDRDCYTKQKIAD